MKSVKIIIEQRKDGFVGYPFGFESDAIVGQGSTYQEALENTRSAITAYIEYYGRKQFRSRFEHGGSLINLFVEEMPLDPKLGAKPQLTTKRAKEILDAAINEFLSDIPPERVEAYFNSYKNDDKD